MTIKFQIDVSNRLYELLNKFAGIDFAGINDKLANYVSN